MNNRKHGQGTHSTKLGADILTKNIPNGPKFSAQAKSLRLGVRTTWTHRLFIVMALSVFCWYNYLMYREFFKVGVSTSSQVLESWNTVPKKGCANSSSKAKSLRLFLLERTEKTNNENWKKNFQHCTILLRHVRQRSVFLKFCEKIFINRVCILLQVGLIMFWLME